MNVRLGLSSRLRLRVGGKQIMAYAYRVLRVCSLDGGRINLRDIAWRFSEVRDWQQAAREPHPVHSLANPFTSREMVVRLVRVHLSRRAIRERKSSDEKKYYWES